MIPKALHLLFCTAGVLAILPGLASGALADNSPISGLPAPVRVKAVHAYPQTILPQTPLHVTVELEGLAPGQRVSVSADGALLTTSDGSRWWSGVVSPPPGYGWRSITVVVSGEGWSLASVQPKCYQTARTLTIKGSDLQHPATALAARSFYFRITGKVVQVKGAEVVVDTGSGFVKLYTAGHMLVVGHFVSAFGNLHLTQPTPELYTRPEWISRLHHFR